LDLISIVLVFGGFFSFLLAISPVGKAVAERIRRGGPDGPDALARRVDNLIDEIEAVRSEVMELGERIDFVERLLPRGSDASVAPRGGDTAAEP
jgi:hypothetical protein